jgi:hypothetical protein
MLHIQSLGAAERGFRDATARSSETLRCFVDQDVLALDAIAAAVARAARAVEPLFARLDVALSTTDTRGFARRKPRFRAREVDAYAVIEALFWGELTAEAETLLKAQLQAHLEQGPVERPTTPSFDDGCVQWTSRVTEGRHARPRRGPTSGFKP